RDQRQVVPFRRGDHGLRQPVGPPAHQLDHQPGDPDRGELVDVGHQRVVLLGQRDPGGQHQLTTVEQLRDVGHLDHVHPADPVLQPARAGHHTRPSLANHREPQDLRDRRIHHPSPTPDRHRRARTPAQHNVRRLTGGRYRLCMVRITCGGDTRTMELIDRHRAVLPSWLALYYDEPIEIVHGSGRRVTDAKGRSYLDFFAGILTNALGYGVTEVNDAVRKQLDSGVLHTSTLYLIRSQVELAERIAELSGIPDAKGFFTNSGTEANEAAQMLATQYRRSDQALAIRNSYHGRAFATIGVTGNRGWSASSLSPVRVSYVHGGYRYRSPFKNSSASDYTKACVDDLRDVLQTATSGDVACMIAEPIQGVGGFTVPPDGLYAAFKEVLDEYGILFISDEAQTGWGRTGEHYWGIQAHGVTPDLMTFAKGLGNGLAIGGVVGRGEIMDCLSANSISTFGGNPVATAGALAVLDY